MKKILVVGLLSFCVMGLVQAKNVPLCKSYCHGVVSSSLQCSIKGDVPCSGSGCIKNCADYQQFIKPAVVKCKQKQFDAGKCFSPYCVKCKKLPKKLQNNPGPTGVGLLCQPGGTKPCCTKNFKGSRGWLLLRQE